MTDRTDRISPAPELRLRIIFDGQNSQPDKDAAPVSAMFGPGKAELLGHVKTTGSIAAAGRAMGMSYKRAWTLIETLNGMFAAPLVESNRGGPRGGGAVLTETGQAVLAAYTAAKTAAVDAAAPHLADMDALRADRQRIYPTGNND
ncbi:MAG: LysR family transcriptional regulator [Octadecabacter sp.]|nr:LysR family transcriptional regulator [Octadecabacter sp.]